MQPLSYDIFPKITVWSKLSDGFQNIASKTKDWFNTITGRRLLGG